MSENQYSSLASPATQTHLFTPPTSFAANSRMNAAAEAELRKKFKESPDSAWAEMGNRLSWFKPFTKIKDVSFKSPVRIRWYEDGTLNASFNCIDRHLAHRGDKVAIIWEGDDPSTPVRRYTYLELAREVGRFANTLKARGVQRGDCVTIYMPMIPEAVFAMLACARIGAMHSVVFGGFSPDSITDRIIDARSRYVITADEGVRGGKKVPLKANVDAALERLDSLAQSAKADVQVREVLVIRHTGAAVAMRAGRDVDYAEVSRGLPHDAPPAEMNAEDPLFMLYTSGSTNKPKGVLHTTGGYMAWTSWTHEHVFDLHENDVYWCTADVGWVTGHSYLVYGPLANGATVLMFEGVPNYPDSSRFWQVIDKHKVTLFYTAPTAIRALMREGEAPVKKTSRQSLRLLGTVGEPINPEAWLWYHRVVGEGLCPIVDTFWQTETGGILISPLPGATATKPGSATRELPGLKPVLLDEKSQRLEGEATGHLCFADSWPGQMRTVFGDHARFEQTYFATHPGYYFTGDGCRRDADGYYWITGRVDDVLNVAGHRLGTAEIESALVGHKSVAEAAVVGFPHDIKGQGIYCFVTLKLGESATEDLRRELTQWVRKHLSPIATPDRIQWAPGLPKTRSGKIMRRILRKIAENAMASAEQKNAQALREVLGDTTTLADPSVVDDLVKLSLTTETR
ncbi:MAG TPA: acetate--CoA ligase [Pseudobdellovibrionaceae bacterium]|nr:acetate--CoA ligase [Pseudobdellovibrionaceae bacterium]